MFPTKVQLVPRYFVLVILDWHQPERVDETLGAEVDGAPLLDDEVAAAHRLQKHLRLGRYVDLQS